MVRCTGRHRERSRMMSTRSRNVMTKETLLRQIFKAVSHLHSSICQRSNAPYTVALPRQTRSTPSTLTEEELELRKQALLKFKTLHQSQKVDPLIYSTFLRSLHPLRTSLSTFSGTNLSPYVNHHALYQSYTSLPVPGIGHMESSDMESFMHEMFSNRTLAKPNMLSSTNIKSLMARSVLRSFLNAQDKRQQYLNMLWQITSDLEAAKIPLSDHERRSMVFRTFYRERPDILAEVSQIAASASDEDAKLASSVISHLSKNIFDLGTYTEVRDSFGDELCTETWNVLLFTALRHQKTDVVATILEEFPSSMFDRATFKIIFENAAFLRDHVLFVKHLTYFCEDHLGLLDIKLLNIIIASLIKLGHIQAAKVLLDPFLTSSTKPLRREEHFLRLLSYADRRSYSSFLTSGSHASTKLHPTEMTFLPFLQHMGESGESFDLIVALLCTMQEVWQLPLSSQVFKVVFRAMATRQYSVADFHFMVGKLVELYDAINATQDSWVNQRLLDSALPENLTSFLSGILDSKTEERSYTDAAPLKLSNTLTRVVFGAAHRSFHGNQAAQHQIQTIESDLEQSLAKAKSFARATFKNELEPLVLNERRELSYLKSMSLLKLLDLTGRSVAEQPKHSS